MNSDKLKSIISKKTNGNSDNSLKLFQMFYFERLLERISKSKYKSKIILKGGLLLSSLIGNDERTTKDMDTTLKGISLTEKMVEKIFSEIISIKLDDGVSFKIVSIKDIRTEDEYGGFRINLLSKLDKNQTFITVELTTGDVITPREINYNYKCIFEEKSISIMAYTFETVIAEKFQTIISRGVLNTRLKDFYDLYVLMNIKSNKINIDVLKTAINKTFHNRKTAIDIDKFYNIVDDIKESDELAKLWLAYQNKNSYANNVDFHKTIEAIEAIIKILEKELVSI